MNTTLFVASHLGAGYQELAAYLNQHPRIEIYDIKGTYESMQDVEKLLNVPHKTNSVSSIYGDTLLYNYQFAFPSLFQWSKFIYLIREPKDSINNILNIDNSPYTELKAFRYYAYRLRRICEIAKRTPGAVVLTWRDLLEDKAKNLISDYLQIDCPSLEIRSSGESPEDLLSYEMFQKSQECYERHLYYLKSLQLRRSF